MTPPIVDPAGRRPGTGQDLRAGRHGSRTATAQSWRSTSEHGDGPPVMAPSCRSTRWTPVDNRAAQVRPAEALRPTSCPSLKTVVRMRSGTIDPQRTARTSVALRSYCRDTPGRLSSVPRNHRGRRVPVAPVADRAATARAARVSALPQCLAQGRGFPPSECGCPPGEGAASADVRTIVERHRVRQNSTPARCGLRPRRQTRPCSSARRCAMRPAIASPDSSSLDIVRPGQTRAAPGSAWRGAPAPLQSGCRLGDRRPSKASPGCGRGLS